MAISERPDIIGDDTRSPWDGQRMTLEEFLALPEQKPALEYIDGVARQKVAAKPVHGSLQIYLGTVFNRVAWPLELGMAFTDTRFLGPEGPLVPDVVFYRSGREDEPESDAPLPEDFTDPPDIAVEIRSPGSPGQSVTEQIEKCTRYQRMGVPITLFIHPEERAVMAFRPGQPLLVLQGDDRIDLDELLPGLDLTVQKMFQESAPAWFRRRRRQVSDTAPPNPEPSS
jgi:Uma2 family endonuclease